MNPSAPVTTATFFIGFPLPRQREFSEDLFVHPLFGRVNYPGICGNLSKPRSIRSMESNSYPSARSLQHLKCLVCLQVQVPHLGLNLFIMPADCMSSLWHNLGA